MDDQIVITIEVPDPSLIKELQVSMDVDPLINDFQRTISSRLKRRRKRFPEGATNGYSTNRQRILQVKWC